MTSSISFEEEKEGDEEVEKKKKEGINGKESKRKRKKMKKKKRRKRRKKTKKKKRRKREEKRKEEEEEEEVSEPCRVNHKVMRVGNGGKTSQRGRSWEHSPEEGSLGEGESGRVLFPWHHIHRHVIAQFKKRVIKLVEELGGCRVLIALASEFLNRNKTNKKKMLKIRFTSGTNQVK